MCFKVRGFISRKWTILVDCCSFSRDIDVTSSKFLSKNKGNYLQRHFVHNYKFSMSNENNRIQGKLTVKYSGRCLTGLSQLKLGWKSCIFCSLTPPIAAAISLAPPAAAGHSWMACRRRYKTLGAPPPTHSYWHKLLTFRRCWNFAKKTTISQVLWAFACQIFLIFSAYLHPVAIVMHKCSPIGLVDTILDAKKSLFILRQRWTMKDLNAVSKFQLLHSTK